MRIRRAASWRDYLLATLINLIWTAAWATPAIVLLILHFALDISIMWSLLAFALWILGAAFFTWFISWSKTAGEQLPSSSDQENKNPYTDRTPGAGPAMRG